MRSLIINDSTFGNTDRVARAIHGRLVMAGEAVIIGVADAGTALDDLPDLLVVGGPTQRHGMSPDLGTFLRGLPRRRPTPLPDPAKRTGMQR